MANSTVSTPARKPSKAKPDKPYEGFPLFPHASGQWAKKIRRHLHYFGVWADPEAALERFNREWPYLSRGEVPPTVDVSTGCALRILVNDFLDTKAAKMEEGELSPRSFRDYHRTCQKLIAHFGKERIVGGMRPEDFRDYRAKLAERLSVTSLRNEINRVMILFNYAHENRLIPTPMHYGQHFDRPSAKTLRRHRNEGGEKLFTRDEIKAILGKADATMTAMVLLGLNCGFGNTDVASLPQSAVDLSGGWVKFPRPKTEINRRIPLWPETIAALKSAIAKRPNPADPAHDGLCFLTRQGRLWVRIEPKKNRKADEVKQDERELFVPDDAIAKKFRAMLTTLKINGRRGLGFYSLRHNFETIGGESKDQVAVDACMGHVDSSMAGNYRHGVSDERLRAVVDTVRLWLWPPKPKRKAAKRKGAKRKGDDE